MPFSTESRRAVVSYWRKYVHEVLVNHLGGLSLPMTLDVYSGRKTTAHNNAILSNLHVQCCVIVIQICFKSSNSVNWELSYDEIC